MITVVTTITGMISVPERFLIIYIYITHCLSVSPAIIDDVIRVSVTLGKRFIDCALLGKHHGPKRQE
jgi:hypothetical protein